MELCRDNANDKIVEKPSPCYSSHERNASEANPEDVDRVGMSTEVIIQPTRITCNLASDGGISLLCELSERKGNRALRSLSNGS